MYIWNMIRGVERGEKRQGGWGEQDQEPHEPDGQWK
jgi:hypothetical protein